MREALHDFTGQYDDFARITAVPLIPCRDIPGTECYCDAQAVSTLLSRMDSFPLEAVHWLDSGDYHYLSKLWTDRIREPFSLVVFDHHTDLQAPSFGNILSCGGWVRDVLRENAYVKEVLEIGVSPVLVAEAPAEERLTIIDETAADSFRTGTFETPVYLSIDLDVLDPAFSRTGWDQGHMHIDTLLRLLGELCAANRLIGIDICGGISRSKGATPEDEKINFALWSRLRTFLKDCHCL